MERRQVLKVLGVAGVSSAVFQRALVTLAADAPALTAAMVRQAEWIAGVPVTDAQRDLMLKELGDALKGYEALRAVPLANAVPPALLFEPGPLPAPRPAAARMPAPRAKKVPLPSAPSAIAYATVAEQSAWLAQRDLSSMELTKLYLDRIAKLDPTLLAAITVTDDVALRQAASADAEIGKGRRLGPLHGIPYGAKDLLAAAGKPTTWGSPLFRDQIFSESAAVIERLAAAGAVLAVKTSVGELAWGDVWYGGTTKNPWKTEQGSSGSSAGSASLVAAGGVGFAIGTETLGSIVSPCTRCGATGLRPTFGRVSRRGAMALSWTMDKIGPIARSAEDCALVFEAIHGADRRDPYSRSAPFAWPPARAPKSIRLGYVKELFDFDYTKWADNDGEKAGYAEWKAFDARTLDDLRGAGYELVPIELKFSVPVGPLGSILVAEAATAFDALLRDGRVEKMVRQTADAWPNVFRQGELVPAVEYLRASRVRTILMGEMAQVFEKVDAYVVPSFGGDNLLATNLTGHPAVVLPNGFRTGDGTPTSITIQGGLDGDDVALAVARDYQAATDFHTKHPAL